MPVLSTTILLEDTHVRSMARAAKGAAQSALICVLLQRIEEPGGGWGLLTDPSNHKIGRLEMMGFKNGNSWIVR